MSALTIRDLNAQPTSQPAKSEKRTISGEENKPQEMDGKSMAEAKTGMENVKQSGAYISPSDAIMSPASQKLVGFKQRQINKQQNGNNTTSRMLFARTPSNCSGGDDDAKADKGKEQQ